MRRIVMQIHDSKQTVKIEDCKLLIVFSSIRFQLLVTAATTLSCYGV